MKVDFIIVGQGLAGTLLANELIRNGKSILVFNDPDQIKASEVAAGLINPVVFRRMTKSWMVDEAFPLMESTYRQLEDLLQNQFYYPERIMKILNEEGSISWKDKVLANRLERYLSIEPDNSLINSNINAPHGFGIVNQSGRLDLKKLISAFYEFLTQQGYLRSEKLDFNQLIFHSNSVHYKEITAEKIIFCEGQAISENLYFHKLKFKHSKGEILDLKIPNLNLKEIINGEVFLMPVGNDQYKVGATYSWYDLNNKTTTSACLELISKLKHITSVNIEILNQQAGIRPTMHDRKQVIGLLPDHPQIGIFNGLGSKGALIGPCFARQFCDYLIGNETYIHPEANINRYFRTNKK